MSSPQNGLPTADAANVLRYNRTLAVAGIGVWEVDLATGTVIWDDICRRLFGLSPDSDANLSEAIALIHPGDRPRIEASLQAALTGQDGGRFDEQYRVPGATDGVTRHIRTTGQVDFAPEGTPVLFSGIAQDLTDWITAHERYNAIERTAQTALKSTGAGWFRITMPSGVFEHSPELAQVMTGSANNKVSRKTLASYIHPADREIRLAAYDTAKETDLLEYTVRFVWDDESVHWVRVAGRYHRDADGTINLFTGTAQDVSPQRRAERELMLKERAIAAADDGIIITGAELPESPIVYVNPAFEAMTGYSAEEIMGQDCRFLQADDRDQPELEHLREAIRAGKPCTVVLRNYRKDGTLFYNELSISPVFEDGKLLHFVGIQKDVTDARSAEDALRRSQELGQAVLNSLDSHIAVLDAEGTIVAVNDAWRRFSAENIAPGAKPFESIGTNYLAVCTVPELPVDADAARANEGIHGVIEGRLPSFQMEYPCHAPDCERWFSLSVTPLGGKRGAVVAHTNITTRKIAEVAVRRSEERFRNIIEQAPIATCVFDGPEFRITLANAPMIRTMGKGRIVEGRPLIEALPELAGQGFLETLTGVYTTGETFEAKAAPARLVVDGEEEIRYFDITFKALRNADGEVYGILDMSADVTAQVVARQIIEEGRAELQFAIDAAELGTWDLSPQTRRFSANARLKEWFGLRPDENIPLSLATDVIADEDRERVTAAIATAMQQGAAPYDEEYTIIHPKTGARRVVRARGKPAFDEMGNAIRFNGTLQDITKEVESRRALEETATKLSSVIQAAPAAIGLFVGRDLIIESPNQTFIDIVGKGWDVVGKPLREAMPELVTEGQPFLKILDDVFTTGVPFVSPDSLVKIVRDGVLTDNYYNITYTPLFDGEGNVYAILDVAIDVTAQVAAQKALEESELFARDLIEHSPVAKAVYTGEDFIVETMNERMLELTGRTPDVIGMSWAEMSPELVGTALEEQMRSVLRTGKSVHFPEARVSHMRGKQLYTGWYNYTYKALRDTAGNIYGVMATAIEITESVEARKELEVQKAYLQNAIDVGNLGTFRVDLQSGAAQYTNNIREWFGLEALDEPLDCVLQNVHPEDRQMVQEVISQSAVDPQHAEHDFVFRTFDKTGAMQHIRSIGRAVYDEEGRGLFISGLIQNVTAQVLQREKIEEGQRQILQSFEQSPVAIALIEEKDLTFSTVNPFYAQLVGRRVEDLVDKPLLEALPEIAGQGFDDLLREVIRSGEAYINHETPVDIERGRGLETIYVDLHYQPRRSDDGTTTGVLVIATDITTSVEARRIVEESEARLRDIVESVPFPIGVYEGREMRIRLVNDALLAAWDRSREDVLGKTFREVLPELEGAGPFEQLDQVYTTGEPFSIRNERVDLVVDGELQTFYYNYDYTPLRDATGQVYAVINTAADVTTAIRAKQQVEEAEAGLRGAIELAELATWRMDVKVGVFHYSPRFMEWLGFSEDTKDLDGAYNPLPGEYRESVPAAIAAALASADGLYENEHPIVNRVTGQTRIIHAQGQVTYDSDGKPATLAGTARDVTKERALQAELERQVRERTQELNAANVSLTRSNEELSQYAYVASHDLQEPLRKIQMFSSILQGQEELPESAPPIINRITQAAERMSTLIQSLLEFSRLLNSEALKRPVNLNDVVSEIVKDFELVVAEKSAKISVGELPTTEAVALQMNQLFYNLIGNALKFSKPNEAPDIRVESKAASVQTIAAHVPAAVLDRQRILENGAEESYHHITVSDNGIGFETRYADQIFEVFKRLHTREVYPGSGIGLALCRRIVEGHAGALWADSTPGVGTTFNILLPKQAEEFDQVSS